MTTKIAGLNIYFEVWGQGKELLMLHGWGGNGREFHPVKDSLAEKFKLIIPDLPGFGNSDIPKKPWTLTDYVIFIDKFLKDLKINNPDFLGHSFGGSILIKLATAYPRKGKLILVDSAGIRKLTLKKAVGKMLVETGKLIFNLPFLNYFYSSSRNLLYNIINEWDYVKAGNLKETFINVINENLALHLVKIKNPTLIVWGENDSVTPLKDGRFLHRQIKNSHFAVIKNAGHLPFFDHPNQFCQIVTDFIKQKYIPAIAR